jgi:hypothetical protein
MKGLTKTACALLMTGGFAAPVPAASGDAGSGPTNGANAGSMNRITSGQNSMTNGQSSMNGQNGMNAGPGGMKISKRLRNDLSKAGFTDIKIMPSSFLVQAKDSQRQPGGDDDRSEFRDCAHGRDSKLQLGRQRQSWPEQERRRDARPELDRRRAAGHPRRGQETLVQPNPVPPVLGASRISRESATAA